MGAFTGAADLSYNTALSLFFSTKIISTSSCPILSSAIVLIGKLASQNAVQKKN